MTIPVILLFVALNLPAVTEMPPDTWTSGGDRIKLLAREGEGLVDYTFEIFPAGGPPEKRTLRSKSLVLEKAWLGPGEKLLVLGRSGTQAAHLLIEEPGPGGNLWIRTWRNELSPSGRYHALERFVSAHGDEVPDVVTIYDLATTPAANHIADEAMPDTFGPRDCVGRVVYPEENAFRKTCRIESLEFRRQIVSPFLWGQGDLVETLFFLAIEGNELFLIRIKVTSASAPAVIWRQQVDLRGRYHPEPGTDPSFKHGLKFWADRLSWTPAGKVKVELDPGYGFGSTFELEPN